MWLSDNRGGKELIKNNKAVSEVIGIMLMLTITVTMASLVMLMSSGFMNEELSLPQLSIVTLSANRDTAQADIKITHSAGDSFKANNWEISVVEVGNSTKFIKSNYTFSVGDQFNVNITTDGNYVYNITHNGIESDTFAPVIVKGKTYNIKIINPLSRQVITDSAVTVI